MCVSSYQSQKSRGLKARGCRTVERTVIMPSLDGTVPGVLLSGAADIVDPLTEGSTLAYMTRIQIIVLVGSFLKSFLSEP